MKKLLLALMNNKDPGTLKKIMNYNLIKIPAH